MNGLFTPSLAMAVVASLVGLGCGSSSTKDSSTTVSGVASAGSAVSQVSLRDSSTSTAVRTATPDATGNFAFDVTGLTPPFFLKGEAESGAVYAIALQGGTVNVNPITTVACSGASSSEDAEDGWSRHDSGSSDHMKDVVQNLGTVLKPLFDLYGITGIGEGDKDHQDDGDHGEKGSHLRALLQDVSFTLDHGVVTVTNRATGAVIFTAPLKDLASGIFRPENMPPGPGTSAPGTCTYAYDVWGACQPDGTQTRTVGSATPAGCTGTPVLSQTCTYVPPANACTSFTYSDFGACQPDNTQTRTVLTSSPAGCTGGTPVLSQACTYVPPCTLATAVASCTTCHGSPSPASHAARALTCATCHGPVGSGTPSVGMTATAGAGGTCVLGYPFGGTHNNGVVNFGAP